MVNIEKEFFRLIRLWASLRRKGSLPTVKSPTLVIMQMMRLSQGAPDAENEGENVFAEKVHPRITPDAETVRENEQIAADLDAAYASKELPDIAKAVIRARYFDHLEPDEIEMRLHLGVKTFSFHHYAAVFELKRIYDCIRAKRVVQCDM